MSRFVRSAVLLGIAILMLLGGYLLQKLENGDTTEDGPDATPPAATLEQG